MIFTPDDYPGLISKPDLQMMLEPHARRFGRCVWPIWERYLKIREEDRLDFDLTAEADVLNRFMIGYAKREFSGVAGVYPAPDEQYGFVLLVDGLSCGIDGQAACRFKKLDVNGRSRNNLSTRRARSVRKNDTATLEGFPPSATWVDVGYVLNDLRTGIAEVQAIRVYDTAFIMSIPREEDGTIGLTYSLLDGPQGGSGEAAQRFIVFPRKEQRGTPDGETPER